MLQRRSGLLKNISNKLFSQAGNSTLILGILGIIAVSFFTAYSYQRKTLDIVVGDVSTDITAVLTSTASGHLYDSFAPVRDGTSGATSYDGVQYREIKNTDKFRAMFTALYKDAHLQGDSIVKLQDGRVVFTISNLRLYVSNASGGNPKSHYRAEYDLIIANGFLWSGSNTTLRDQVQTVEYMNRF